MPRMVLHLKTRDRPRSCHYYATVSVSGVPDRPMIGVERSRTTRQIIPKGTTKTASTVDQVDAGQFIAASASGEALVETTTQTTGIATASKESSAMSAVKGYIRSRRPHKNADVDTTIANMVVGINAIDC